MKSLVLFVFLLICFVQTNAQTGTEFWFAAPEVTQNHGDRPIFLRFTALDQATIVNVYQPAISSTALFTINIAANSSQSINLTSSIASIENDQPNQISTKGLFIKSTSKVSVYYEVASSINTDIFVLKGSNALGTNFLVPSQNNMNNANYGIPAAKNGFDIVATEDNTQVTITPTANLVGRNAGVPFTINLNKGEVYSAVALDVTAVGHLGGSVVVANKPVAITLKDDSINSPNSSCADISGDQIIPTSLAGNKFITLPGYLNNPSGTPTDWVYIMAVENNTQITINGVNAGLLNRAQILRRESNNNVFYIETSKPVLVWHLSGFGCELGGAILPQIECTGSRTVGVVRGGASNEAFYMNILVQTGGEGSFTFNGNTGIINANQFLDVPFSNGTWKYARIQLTTTQLATGAAGIIRNSTKDFHLGVINGGSSSGCRYGYFSDFNKFSDVIVTSNSPLCEGTALQLNTSVASSSSDYTFQWSGPNGFTNNTQNASISNIQQGQAGMYNLLVTKPGCSSQSFPINVLVNASPLNDASSNSPLCAPNTLQLTSTNITGATFQWSGPNGFTSTSPSATINNTSVNDGGSYQLSVTKDGCSTTKTIPVIINTPITATASNNGPYCEGQTLLLTATSNNTNATFSWSGPNGFTSNNANVAIPNSTILNGGGYTLTASLLGCTNAVTSTIVVVNSGPGSLAGISVTPACSGTNVNFTGSSPSSGVTQQWQGPSGYTNNQFNFSLNNIQINQSGKYYLLVSKDGCTSKDSVELIVHPYPNAQINGNTAICDGSSLTLSNNNNIAGSIYNWTGPNGSSSSNQNLNISSVNNSQAGKYKLTVTNIICTRQDSVEVVVKPIPQLNFNNLPSVCANASAVQLNQASEISGLLGSGVYSGNGVSNGVFQPTLAGVGNHTIKYTFTANNGCLKDTSKSISVYPVPIVDAGQSKTIIEGSSTIINGSTTVAGVVQWSPTAFLSPLNSLTPIASPKQTTLYTLKVISPQNCIGTDTVLIKVLKKISIPNCFTPNGDGINDTWEILGLENYVNADIRIFNRNGVEVFYSKGYRQPWNGSIAGKPLPIATYYYVILTNDGVITQPFTGWLQILR